MKRFAIIFVLLILLVIFASCGKSEDVISDTDSDKDVSVLVDPEPHTEALTECDTEYPDIELPVRLVTGTTSNMMFADYWSTDDTVLMTRDEINSANEENKLFVSCLDTEGSVQKIYPSEIDDTVDGDIAGAIIGSNNIPEEDTQYVNGALPDKDYWALIDENRALDLIDGKVKVRFAVCTDRTTAWAYPCDDFVTDTDDDIYYNNASNAELMTGSFVPVIHESRDGEWFYVLVGAYGGWVRKDKIAFFHDRAEWEAARDPEKFLVVTGNNVRLDETASHTPSSGKTLPMGMKLRLADEIPDSIDGRATYSCYAAELPVRDEDGTVAWEIVAIPMARDVHVGYLELTSHVVLEQAFKFLGQIYGWAGDFSANDCSGITDQIFACFGITLPRNSSKIGAVEGFDRGEFGDMTDEERLKTISSLLPGSILQFPGHIMIYLGTRGGMPYVISACGMMAAADQLGKEEVEIEDVNCVCVTPLNVVRKNGKTWLQNMNAYVNLKAK